ncbi:MAG: alpha-2-macroglobulin [Acidobacteriota bacterium]|jgi:uncharacterized protein YfaS (alpha-2-macroglobulin family)|nr:alpha-2-macroglobulin [Acidobacteriota bacterium]
MKKFAVLFLLLASNLLAADKLTITRVGPVGEIAQLSEANEVRVVFSEPMVVVGKIPKVVTAPFFHIAPEVKGTFRWAGTTTLIFTPDPKSPLPFATKFDVTIDDTATAVSGKKLDKRYSFSFTTPTIQLQSVDWYRKDQNINSGVVIALSFNQPVDADTIAPHLQLRYKPHELTPLPPAPAPPDPAFDAKLAKANAVAASSAPVLSFFPTEWNKERFPARKELVIIETKPGIPPDAQLQLLLDGELAKTPTSVRRGRAQDFTIELEPALFVKSISCTARCNPESSNRIELRTRYGVAFDEMKKAVTVVDVTDPASPKPLPQTPPSRDWDSPSESFSLDELGFALVPAHTYAIAIAPTLTAVDKQTLGYRYSTTAEYWHKPAFTSFGDGHGVWESSGGPLLPFYARNFRNVKQWLSPLSLETLMPSIAGLEKNGFTKPPATQPQDRKLAPAPDKIQSYGFDVSSASPGGKGLMWVALQEGETLPRTERYNPEEIQIRATVVQVTNLGITVKDSPLNTLIFVTRLDNAAPVAGAKVAIRDLDNKVVWSGKTDDKGIAVAPSTPLLRAAVKTAEAQARTESDEEDPYEDHWSAVSELRFIVTAEKEGDVAYVASNWTDGILPYEFDLNFELAEQHPLLRGTVFSDRGVYKPGEEVHLKAVLRTDTPNGMQLLTPATSVTIVVKDAHDKEVDRRKLPLNEWSSGEWTWKVPADGVLGTYRVMARVEGQRLRVYGDFLVAAYRRPDFRVDVKLTAPTSIAGTKVDGRISGRYLFGGAMAGRPAKWTYSKTPLNDVPRAIRERFGESQYTFLGYDSESSREAVTISSKEQKLDSKGDLALKLDTDAAAGWPWSYVLEGDVTDVSRQKIAGRNSVRIDPAPWYIGIKTPPYFADAQSGIDTAFVAAGLDGNAVAGVTVDVELRRIQWNSVRNAVGNGFYEWTTERKEIASGNWTVSTTAQPATLHVPITEGGEYVLVATAKDGPRSTTSRAWFYASGGGYTAWARYDHNRIDLVPERQTYKPGESARIIVKSPWERATALVTTEREGIRTWKQFELTSTQQTISVPITEKDIPNVFVSVLLLKGRTKEPGGNDEGDPGKPSFRLGYVELDVEDATKRLTVDVKANQAEYRPATKAKIEVNVRDAKGAGTRSEVTLWAVDYGVLSLTGYKTPDVLDSIYLKKALQVVTEESRQKVISRRVLTPKGVTDGGGGGRDAGPGVLRKDFRVLAFWLGSLVTDKNGRARTEITLPESLTTYRIMAVAGDKASRFGWAQNEIRINKPLLLTSAFPRFLALGDKALFGSVIHSQLKTGGKATVTVQSVDPSIVTIEGDATQRIDVAPGGAIEVRFNAIAKAVGDARIRMSVAMNGESDAFEDVLPVRLLLPADTVAAYGDTTSQARETLAVPNDAIPSVGGLRVELASTQLVNLAEGAQYLIDYPYGCAEQRSSGALSLMLASDLGDAFRLPNLNAATARAAAQQTIAELYKFQCGNGGFAFWAGDCDGTSPYLTAWVLHVLQRAQSLQYGVSKDVLDRGYRYLDTSISSEKRPANEGYWPSYTAWQAFAVKTLAEGKVNQDSNINRLIGFVDRMPLFGIAHLADALRASGDKGPRYADLHRRLTNAIAPEAGSAHVEELRDEYLLWLWSSNTRSTAIVLGTLVRGGEDEPLVKQMVRWLMHEREGGRWGNTQENAWAMESLVDYYRRYESAVPDFTGVVTVGKETIARDEFRGRTTAAQAHDIPIAQLPRAEVPVTFDRQGPAGTLFYLMRLRYAAPSHMTEPRDQAFRVERRYALQGAKAESKSFKAGDLIKVTLTIRNTKERRFVAITDPIPAGTEPVESWFATTTTELVDAQRKEESRAAGSDWMWWRRGGFDHVERHDDRVNLFATRLSEGPHEYSYLVRATTAGTFTAAPMHAEEMYTPEVFGRTASDEVEVRP